MNFISRMLARMGQKVSAAGWITSYQRIGQAQWTKHNYKQLSEESYMKCVVSYRCVRMAAQGAAKIPFILRDKNTRKEIEDHNHPLWVVLHKPNPFQSGASFWEAVYAYRKLNGNSYIEGVVGDADPAPMGEGRPPDQLWCKRPDYMKVVAGGQGTPAGYVYESASQKQVWDCDPLTGAGGIIHWKTFHPLDDWYGFPEVVANAWSIDSFNEASAWNKSLLQNSGAPSGVMQRKIDPDAPTVLTEKQYAQIKERMEREMKGAKNAGNMPLLDGGLEWTAMGLSPREMDWIEGKHVSAREIALGHGTPPMLLGIPGDNTYNNNREARMGFFEDTVLPDVDSLCDDLNMKLAPLFDENIEIGYDEDEVPALAPKRESKWAAVQNSDWLTVDEKREATGYEPLGTPESEMVFIPSNVVPLEGALDAPEPPLGPDGQPLDPNADPNAPPDPNKPPAKPTDAQVVAKMQRERKAAERMVKIAMGVTARKGRRG